MSDRLLCKEKVQLLTRLKPDLAEPVEMPQLEVLLPKLQSRDILTRNEMHAASACTTPFSKMCAIIDSLAKGTEKDYIGFLECLEDRGVGLKALAKLLRDNDPQRNGNCHQYAETMENLQ